MLDRCRVLIAEDEFYLAADLVRTLAGAGATIIGPISTLTGLKGQIAADGFDAALLDIRLDGGLVYPAADLIRQAGIPLAFLTGYDHAEIPARFAAVPLCQKPCSDDLVLQTVHDLCKRNQPAS